MNLPRHSVQNAAPGAPLAVSMGDPAGIGADIIVAAFAAARRDARVPPFYAIAEPSLLADRARLLGHPMPVAEIESPGEACQVFAEALPVLPLALEAPVVAGQPDPANAPATIASIDRAVSDVLAGSASAVVTAPIAKSVLYQAGFAHPGHTEYLAALAALHLPGRSFRPVMMLAADELRVVPATIHISLRAVPDALDAMVLRETILIVAEALRRDFGIGVPRIAVAGLNPHAGEDGSMGREEIEIISPVLASLKREGIAVSGPLPADTMFHARARASYDAAVCMYHDQALIPIKTLAFDRGVNATLGLPFIRTSPDHGTAFSIAGTGQADATSFIEALKLADRMAAVRAAADTAAAPATAP